MPEARRPWPSEAIVAKRPPRHQVDPARPYAWLVEPERNARGCVVDVATLFLTNRECPFRCLMCDLWKHTLTHSVAEGEIPGQIHYGLSQLPPAGEIKLYNSGNFFDPRAIPVADYAAIADVVRGFDTVVVENHPRLCGDLCFRFRDLIAPAQLEVAIGLETCHPEVLKFLNKAMTLDDFDSAVARLHAGGIRTRVFLLHQPPLLDAGNAAEWSLRSIDYAFDRGVNCCSVIATRSGNGAVDALQAEGLFTPPRGSSLEQVQSSGIGKQRGRVFVDLWEIERFFDCDDCRAARIARMRQMNLSQQLQAAIRCDRCDEDDARALREVGTP